MQTLTHSLKSLSRTMSPTWTRLIRFVDDFGNETFGEPVISDDKDFADRLAAGDLWAVEYKGQSPVSALTKGEKVHVKALRDLLRPADVPIIKCIGLNYIKHSKICVANGGEWNANCVQLRRVAGLLPLTPLSSLSLRLV